MSWKPGTAAGVPASWNSALKKLLPATCAVAAGRARSVAVRSQRAYSFCFNAVYATVSANAAVRYVVYTRQVLSSGLVAVRVLWK